jgi:hypothetical protein
MLCVNANMTSGRWLPPYGLNTVQRRILPLGLSRPAPSVNAKAPGTDFPEPGTFST